MLCLWFRILRHAVRYVQPTYPFWVGWIWQRQKAMGMFVVLHVHSLPFPHLIEQTFFFFHFHFVSTRSSVSLLITFYPIHTYPLTPHRPFLYFLLLFLPYFLYILFRLLKPYVELHIGFIMTTYFILFYVFLYDYDYNRNSHNLI